MNEKILNELKRFEEAAAACNRCGFCTSYCPTYVVTGSESHSPRGRNQAFRALLEGKLTDPLAAKEIFDTCLLCGECTSVCFSEVPTAQLMVQARNMMNNAAGLPWATRFVLEKLLPFPARFRRILKIMFFGKRWGLSWLLRKMGVLDFISPVLAAGDEMVGHVPLSFFIDRTRTKKYQDEAFNKRERTYFIAQREASQLKEKGRAIPDALAKKIATKPLRAKIAFMPLCGSQYVRPSVSLATLKLLELLKLDISIPAAVCCGLPAASYGALESVRVLAKDNIIRFERARFDSIVGDDSSCLSHIKEYPKYFQEDRAWYDRAHAVSSRARELSSFLIQWGLLDRLKNVTWLGGAVAYHDPCKAQYAQKVTQPPRELLSTIKGLKLVAVADADQCCGGGGTYSMTHAVMSREVLAKKIKTIVESNCKIVVTSSVSCLLQLSFGLRQADSSIEALHLSEFLVRAMEKGK